MLLHALRATINGVESTPPDSCSLRERENRFSVACIALAHDASNVPVGGSKLAPMKAPLDAPERQIIRSWNANGRVTGVDVVPEFREPTAPGAIAPASVIFICKARVREQTGRMEPPRVERH
jgi:hypothetical protein